MTKLTRKTKSVRKYKTRNSRVKNTKTRRSTKNSMKNKRKMFRKQSYNKPPHPQKWR